MSGEHRTEIRAHNGVPVTYCLTHGQDYDLCEADEKCTCPYVDPKYHFTYYGATEPGSMQEWDPDCPVHGRPDDAGVCTCGEEPDHEIHCDDEIGGWHPYWDVEWGDHPVKGTGLLVTPMDSEGNVTGPSREVAAQVRAIQFSMPDNKVVEVDPLDSPYLKTFSLDVSFSEVDPDLIGLLTGAIDKAIEETEPTFSVETYVPARRRTFWEWLTRKPKHLAWYTFIPNAKVVSKDE